MQTIAEYNVFDFSGGIRRDKSLFALQKNELLDARNVLIDEQGRVKVRRGSQQVGQTLTGNIESSFVFERFDAGSTPSVVFLVANNASTGVISILRSQRLTTALTTASTSVVCDSVANFAASGTVEIEGDLITYTGGGGGGTTLTGASSITTSHPAGAAVHQWATLAQSGTAVDGRMGVYYTVLDNTLIINGRLGNWKQYDAASVTDVSSEPAGIFITNYRDRAYVAGDNTSGGTNPDPRRVSFSARGNATSWTSSDFFDVEDQRGEPITGFRVLGDRLGIFKINSTFTYDEIELKQRLFNVGAYNHRVTQEIDNVVYTFCPEGIFATNFLEARQIGDPVKQYWKNFKPIFDSALQRVVTNTFSGKFENHYKLYISDITDPDSTNDVVLDYDTKNKEWTVETGSATDFFHFGSFNKFRFGDRPQNYFPALFGGNSSGQYFRFYENRYIDSQSTPVVQGGDVYTDMFSNTGNPVSGVIETGLYDLTHPGLLKKFRELRVFSEQGGWHIDYRVQNDSGITPYRPCGYVRGSVGTITLPKDAEGYRIGFRFTASEVNYTPSLNGFSIRNTEVINRM